MLKADGAQEDGQLQAGGSSTNGINHVEPATNGRPNRTTRAGTLCDLAGSIEKQLTGQTAAEVDQRDLKENYIGTRFRHIEPHEKKWLHRTGCSRRRHTKTAVDDASVDGRNGDTAADRSTSRFLRNIHCREAARFAIELSAAHIGTADEAEILRGLISIASRSMMRQTLA